MQETIDDPTFVDRKRFALEQAVRVAGVGVVVCDTNENIVQVDEIAERWLNVEGSRQLLDEVLHSAVEGAHVVKTLAGFDSNALCLKFVGSPIHDRETLVGAVAVIEDNTRERFAEIAQRELVANVGHELKTPIAAMGLLAETLVNESDPDSSAQLAERLSQQAMRAGHVIDDLLGLGTRARKTDTMTSSHAMCSEVIERLRPAAELRNIEFVVSGDDVDIVGEPIEIISALHHLVDNAIKFSPNNAEIRIATVADDENCEISVADTGNGIAGAHINRIFERFYQVDAGASRFSGGTGLGLAIVKHGVELNGGSVRVESVEGKGSTFTIKMKRGVAR